MVVLSTQRQCSEPLLQTEEALDAFDASIAMGGKCSSAESLRHTEQTVTKDPLGYSHSSSSNSPDLHQNPRNDLAKISLRGPKKQGQLIFKKIARSSQTPHKKMYIYIYNLIKQNHDGFFEPGPPLFAPRCIIEDGLETFEAWQRGRQNGGQKTFLHF